MVEHSLDIDDHGPRFDPATVGTILVVHPGGLSRMVKAVPALRHLRQRFPISRIVVAAPTNSLELLDSCPYVDMTLEIAPSDELQAEFDLALVLGHPEEAIDLDGLGVAAKRTAGYRLADGEDEYDIHPIWPDRIPESQRMLRLVWLLGGPPPDDAPLALWPTLADRNSAALLMRGDDNRPMAIVHVGSSHTSRHWPVDRFARVVDMLDSMGFRTVLVGVDSDAVVGRVLEGLTGARCRNLIGATSVGVLAGLIERTSVFVGTDSGPALLASVLGAHTVIVGPRSTIEQFGTVDRTSYVLSSNEADDHHELPEAAAVTAEAVLAEVALAAEHGKRQWQAHRDALK
jgi:ADP-heptose:LPS heptosyltransferase